MSEKIQFRALQIANVQRSSYGLRYHDFGRYRKHCANRTHRLRSTLKMTHGKGRDFKKLPALNLQTMTSGHLELLLLESERAWAYSQDLISQATNSENASSLRHQATGRFRRGINWSAKLLEHCNALFATSCLSAHDLLEVTIYTLIMNGRFLRYRDDLEDALVLLGISRNLLDELAFSATTSKDQALATLFADEISPEIRYCAHELGRAQAYDVDSIVLEVSTKHQNERVEGCENIIKKFKEEERTISADRKKLSPLMWDDQPIPIRNPELVDVLLKVQAAEHKLVTSAEAKSSKEGVASYDAILHALSDAEEVARKLSEIQGAGGNSSSTPAGARDIHFIHAYIVYRLLSHRIQRDLVLVSALYNPNGKSKDVQTDGRVLPAVVKLLDTVIQSLIQIRGLSIVDDSPDLAIDIDARIGYTKARRFMFLAHCYIPFKKYAEALTLLQHASINIRETKSVLSGLAEESTTASFYPLSIESVSELESIVSSDTFKFKRAWFAYNGGSSTLDAKDYKKPLFFDIALNYVDLDMDELRVRAGLARVVQDVTTPALTAKSKVEDERVSTPEPQQAAARGGLSSLLGGWWGR